MNQEYLTKIQLLKKKYAEDPSGLEEIAAWEQRIKKSNDFKEFSKFNAAQILIEYLKKRIKEMRLVKAFSKRMTESEYAILEAKIQECDDTLKLVCPEYDTDMKNIFNEIDTALEQ